MSSPFAARVAADALGMTPTSYGHLIMLAARFARLRLDGHVVVNRQTRLPIILAWQRGLDRAAAPGMPPALLLAVPAIPAMLAEGRYIGAFTMPSPPPDVVRYHAFEATAEICGRRVVAVLIVREDRRHRFSLDRVVAGGTAAHRRNGGAAQDFGDAGGVISRSIASTTPDDPQSGASDPNIVLAQFVPPVALPMPGVPPAPYAPGSTAVPNAKLGNAVIHLLDPRPLFDALGNVIHNEPPPPDDGKKKAAPAPDSGPPASAPVGSSRAPIEIQKGTNSPANIEGTDYSGHAIDKMQGRGIPPSVAGEVIEEGQAAPSKQPGTTTHYDPANNVTVVTNTATGKVITVRKGRPEGRP